MERLHTTVAELVDGGVLERPMDGNHGELHPRGEDFVPDGIPFIMASDLINGCVNIRDCKFISRRQADSLRKGFSIEGDVLLSHKATIGRTAIVNGVTTGYVVLTPQVTYYRVIDPERLNNRYLKYYFDSTEFQQILGAWAGAGSTRAYLGITGQQKLPIVLPPIAEQRAIASILGALDDKIEQNRRTARALERLARAIFRAWFVDFEPVKAKAAGATSFPGMPQPDFDALPTRFVESAIGPVPEGRSVLRLDDVLTLQRGFDLPKQSRRDGPHPIFAASGMNGWHSEWKVKGPGVTTGRSGVLGQVFYVDGDFWPLNTSLWVKEYTRSNPWHAYFLLQTLNLAQFNAGSAVPTLNRNHVHSLPVVSAPDCLLKEFANICGPTFAMRKHLSIESEKLAEMRDYLLPRLLGGNARVEVANG